MGLGILKRAVRAWYTALKVPAQYPLPARGFLRVLAGLATLFDDLQLPRRTQRPWVNADASTLYDPPYHHEDPIGAYLAGLIPSLPEGLTDDYAAWRDITRQIYLTHAHKRALIRDALDCTIAVCESEHIVAGGWPVRSSAVHRCRLYRWCLDADPDLLEGDTRDERMESARGQVEPIIRRRLLRENNDETPVFCDTWLQPRIPHLRRGHALNQADRPESDARSKAKRRRRILPPDPEDERSAEETWFPPGHRLPKDKGERAQWYRSIAFQTAVTPGPMPDSGSLSESEMTLILDATAGANPRDTPGVLLRLVARTFVPLDSLLCAVHVRGPIPLIRVPVCRSHRDPTAPTLYRKCSPQILLRLSRDEIRVLRRARRNLRPGGKKPLVATIRRRLHELVPNATLAKFQHSLYRHACAWWGVTWPIILSGLTAGREKAHAVRSYVHCSARSWRHALPYHRRFWSATSLRDIPYRGAWGSALVPRDTVVRAWFDHLRAMATADPPTALGALIGWANTFAALVHLGFLILSGLRNVPMSPPRPEMLTAVGWDVIWQKQHPLILSASPSSVSLLRWAQHVTHRIDLALAKAGHRKSCDAPYAFLGLGMGHEVVTLRCSHRQIRDAFRSTPNLHRYEALERNAHRHWSITAAHESNMFGELAIQAYHHHCFSCFSPLARNRIEPVIDWESRTAIARFLAARAGIPGL